MMRKRMNIRAPDGSLAGYVERIDAHKWRGYVASKAEPVEVGYLQDVRRTIIADWQSGGIGKPA